MKNYFVLIMRLVVAGDVEGLSRVLSSLPSHDKRQVLTRARGSDIFRHAVVLGNRDIVRALLFHLRTVSTSSERLNMFLFNNGENAAQGATALIMMAAQYGHVSILEALLDAVDTPEQLT